jgi:hypothetical protein
MKVELLLALDDNTWETEIVDYPNPENVTTWDVSFLDIVEWANQNLMPCEKYRNVVLFAVYNIPSQEELRQLGEG